MMGRADGCARIHKKRPTANLMSKKVLTSLIGQVLVQITFQTVLFFNVRAQPWYVYIHGEMHFLDRIDIRFFWLIGTRRLRSKTSTRTTFDRSSKWMDDATSPLPYLLIRC